MLPARKTWLALLALAVASTMAYADPAPEPRAVTADETKWIVPDAEGILKLNIKAMMGSELMKKNGADAIKGLIQSNEQARSVIDATGLDVTKDIDAIVISATGSAKDAKGRVIVKGKFNKDKIHDALKKEAEKGAKVKLVKEGTTQLYELLLNDDKALFGAFADGSTLVLTDNKEQTAALIKSPPTKPAAMSPKLRTALSKFTGKESLAVALVVNDDVKKMLGNPRAGGDAAAKLQTLTAAMTLTGGVALNITGTTNDAGAAKSLEKTLAMWKATGSMLLGMNEDLPPFVGELINGVKIASNPDSVTINLTVSKETISKIAPGGK